MKYLKKFEKVGDDYSTWKQFQLFFFLYGRNNNEFIHICITTKDEWSPGQYQIKKLYLYDTREEIPKIKKSNEFYFSPNLDDPKIIYQSDSFEEIYKEFELTIKEAEIRRNAKKYNL